jgi:hypothetical protein
VLSSYFAGFVIGAVNCSRIITRVGHIRAYAGCAGLVVASTIAMPAVIGPRMARQAPLSGWDARNLCHDRKLAEVPRPIRRSAGGCSRSTWLAHSRHWPLANFSSLDRDRLVHPFQRYRGAFRHCARHCRMTRAVAPGLR